MIIVPDDPGPVTSAEALQAAVVKVFDGDGFLANVWHPIRATWVERVPFRFAFIDAPEMGQPFGQESKDFLGDLIARKSLRLDPIGKESTGYILAVCRHLKFPTVVAEGANSLKRITDELHAVAPHLDTGGFPENWLSKMPGTHS